MNDIDKIIVALANVVLFAGRQDQYLCRAHLGSVLASLGEIPDVHDKDGFSWMEVQRQCSLAMTALDSCRRPPVERPGKREELIEDARKRAVACIRAAHELSCGRGGF